MYDMGFSLIEGTGSRKGAQSELGLGRDAEARCLGT